MNKVTNFINVFLLIVLSVVCSATTVFLLRGWFSSQVGMLFPEHVDRLNDIINSFSNLEEVESTSEKLLERQKSLVKEIGELTVQMVTLKAEVEELEKSIQETQIVGSLVNSYRSSYALAIEQFQIEMDEALKSALESIENGRASLGMTILSWATDAEGVVDRWMDSEKKREIAYSKIQEKIDELYTPVLGLYVADCEQAILNLEARIGMKKAALPDHNKLKEFREISGVEEILKFLNSRIQTGLAVLEEAATWIPVVGDAYDMSRMKWDFREIKVFEPNVEKASNFVIRNLGNRLTEENNSLTARIVSLAEAYSSKLTAEDLYAKYQAAR